MQGHERADTYSTVVFAGRCHNELRRIHGSVKDKNAVVLGLLPRDRAVDVVSVAQHPRVDDRKAAEGEAVLQTVLAYARRGLGHGMEGRRVQPDVLSVWRESGNRTWAVTDNCAVQTWRG